MQINKLTEPIKKIKRNNKEGNHCERILVVVVENVFSRIKTFFEFDLYKRIERGNNDIRFATNSTEDERVL
jgi:hypothetical protein